MEEKVRAFIKENQMIQPGDGIVLGLSGGADSVCLFFLLLGLRKEIDFKLACVHVHHGLRGAAADGDEAFSAGLCRRYDVPCKSFFFDVKREAQKRGVSEEEEGRYLRYQSFEEVLNGLGYNKIAVAHHMGDQAETVLYHLCRGSGLSGLSGMRPVSGNRIRPLLCVGREEITAYLTERRISWREDGTNETLMYTRNRIRNVVLPCLREHVNPSSSEHIAACASAALEAERYIEKQAKKAWEAGAREACGEVRFSLSEYEELDVVIRKQLIFMAADFLGCGRKDITAVHLSMVLGLLQAATGKEVRLPGRLCVRREYGELVFSRCEVLPGNRGALSLGAEAAGEYELPDGSGSLLLSGPVPAEEIPLKEIAKNEENTYTKWFDYDKIKDTLQLRNRQEGDYIEISADGSRKKLKSYLIDKKIPRQLRDSIWLLADGSHILWIIGYRISEGCKIGPGTGRAVRAEIKWR